MALTLDHPKPGDSIVIGTPVQRTRWEYRRLRMMTHEPDDLAALNAAGAEGWELVSVEMLYQRYFLKRRVT